METPLWRGTASSDQRPAEACQPPGEQHFHPQQSLQMTRASQESPCWSCLATPHLNSWPTETVRNNSYCCFKPLSFDLFVPQQFKNYSSSCVLRKDLLKGPIQVSSQTYLLWEALPSNLARIAPALIPPLCPAVSALCLQLKVGVCCVSSPQKWKPGEDKDYFTHYCL